jgi:hypothetical protein
MKIRPVGAELLHADRHNEVNSRFSQFFERIYKQLVNAVQFVPRSKHTPSQLYKPVN